MTVEVAETKPTETEDDESEYETEYESEEDEEEVIIRMKWCADGSKTLDDIIERLKGQIEYMESLKEEGYELVREMNDDWGFARIVKEPVAVTPEVSPIPIVVDDEDNDEVEEVA